MTLNLQTIVCSTRPGRIGMSVAQWAQGAAQAHGKFQAELIDLADFKLPLLDEPELPRLRKYRNEHTKAWSRSVQAADAFVFVMPEYNSGPPASIVNALSYLVLEWQYKPVGFVTYGGISGGLRAAQTLKPVLTTLKMMPLPEAVVIPNVAAQLDAEAGFKPTEMHEGAAKLMLEELHRWAQAIKPLRSI